MRSDCRTAGLLVDRSTSVDSASATESECDVELEITNESLCGLDLPNQEIDPDDGYVYFDAISDSESTDKNYPDDDFVCGHLFVCLLSLLSLHTSSLIFF